MEEFFGKEYVLVKHEHFDDYLKYLGHNYFMRKVALGLRPSHCLRRSPDGTYTFTMTSVLANSSITFVEGEEFEELRPPSDQVKSVVTFRDNKMIHIQKEENGRTSTHIREFNSNQMIVITTADNNEFKCIRYYELCPSRG